MKVGLCVCVKDEEDINEFLAHHILLGFDKIFIYDNNSKVKVSEVLSKNLKEFVEIKEDKSPYCNQAPCYTECLNNNKDYDWILLCDADEMLYLKNHDNIKDFLKLVPIKYSILVVNWLCFGQGNQLVRDKSKLMIEQFLYREPYKFYSNEFIKCFVRPNKISEYGIHKPRGRLKNIACNVYFQLIYVKRFGEKCIDYNFNDNTPLFQVHYITKDKNSFINKRLKQIESRQNCYNQAHKYTEYWYKYHFKDEILDTRIRDKYAEKIKNFLNK